MTSEPTESAESTVVTDLVGDVPIAYVRPTSGPPRPPLALWVPHLTGTKEDYVPVLSRLADAGYLAISLDPWQHGERGDESPDQIAARVFAGFRDHMWPILGQTTLDAKRVIDWALTDLARPDVVAGGVSMGGDIAVALAGIDPGCAESRRSSPPRTGPVLACGDSPIRRRSSTKATRGDRSIVLRPTRSHHPPRCLLPPAGDRVRERGRGHPHPARRSDPIPRRAEHRTSGDGGSSARHRSSRVGHFDGAQSEVLLSRAIEWLISAPR